MENASNLKECPFCGEKAAINEFRIFCINCNCRMVLKGWKEKSTELLIKEWNARTQSPESSRLVSINNKPCNHNNCTELDNRYWWCKDCGALRNDKYDWALPNNSYKFSTQQSKLAPLKWKEIFDMISDRTHYSAESANDLATEICLKYGSPTVPSVEKIEKVISRWNNIPFENNQMMEIAEAIHRLLTNGEEGKEGKGREMKIKV